MTCDGICVFSNPIIESNKSSFPILLKLLNYNKERINDQRVFWTYCITKESLSNTILTILMKELSILSSGIEMDVFINGRIEKKRVVAVLLSAYGDCAAVTNVGSFTGSSSSYPCRYCELFWNRTNDDFHLGIKCAYESIKNYVTIDDTNKKLLNIRYPSISLPLYNSHNSSSSPPQEDTIITSQILIESISDDHIFTDAFDTITYNQRTKESIQNNRELSSENGSNIGIKQKPSVFESLTYFDASTSYTLDPMHLFNNVCTLILNLLFHYNVTDYTTKLAKNDSINPQKLLMTYCLDDENMSILNSRILAINTLYNDNEYEFRYILNEKKFYNMSSHTRIFFTSCILPLITLDFSASDSPLILLIDPLATIIRNVYIYRGNTSQNILNMFKDQCYIFCFLCELLLPKEILNTQLHLIQHLYDSIINSGSIYYASTFQSERFYSFLKRVSFGRKNFNESCIRCVIEREVLDINMKKYSNDYILDEFSIDSNSITNNDNESRISIDIHPQQIISDTFNSIIINYNGIDTVKGIRGIDKIKLYKNDMKDIAKIILSSNDSILKERLYQGIDINEIIYVDDILNDPSLCKIIFNNLEKLEMTFYSEIILNDSIIFNSSDIDQGIETIDNSYIMYFTYDTINSHKVHLIKALCYIQIGSLLLIKKHEYPYARVSTTGLYYIVNDSNEVLSKRKEYVSSFISISDIEPFNLIIADVHEYINRNNDETYAEGNEKDDQDNTGVVDGRTVITNTVFITRHNNTI
ncbi:hypothetical protein WA158_006981 [Blastocystis sp. Blastoise]